MTIAATNKIMQGSVAFILQEQAGAVSQERLSEAYDIDSDQTTGLTYGQWVERGTHKGANAVDASTNLGMVLGVVPYQSSGIIDDSGYDDGFYTNVPVLKQGVLYVGATGTIDLDSTLYLIVDPNVTGYGKVKNGSVSGAIDISSIAKPIKKSANNLVLIDINII
jgi:hypothetical protein